MKYLAAWLGMALGYAEVMLSDLFIRSREIPGTDAEAYDAVGTLTMVIFGVMLVWMLSKSMDQPKSQRRNDA